MRHTRRIISISLAMLMLVSLCAVCASTGVTAATTTKATTTTKTTTATVATTSGVTQASSQAKIANIVGAPPGGLDGAPAVCSWGPNRLDVFARSQDHNLWHTWWDGNWHSWENLGAPAGGLASAPTAASWGAGRIDVFARGADGMLWHKWFPYSSSWWSGWEGLGTPMGYSIKQYAAPAACSFGANRLDIFILGDDGQLWQKWFAGSGGWQPWVPLGAPWTGLDGAPGAFSSVSWGYPRVDVFIRGADGALWQKWWSNGWQPWHRFDDTAGRVARGSQTAIYYQSHYFAPAVCSWGANRLDVFFLDTNNEIQQKFFNGNWQPLISLGGAAGMGSSPGAVTWQVYGVTRIDIFCCGGFYERPAFPLWQLYWDPSGWHDWINLGWV